MKKLTKKHLEKLKAVERYLYTTVELQFKHNTTATQNDIVADALDYVYGTSNSRNYGCSRCVYNMYERLGKIYFKQLKEEQLEETTTTTEVEETTTTTEETTTTTIAEEKEPNQIINELEPMVTKTKNKRGRKGK